MSRSHQLAWAAGFFDGEGFVTIQKRTGKYDSHYLRVGINHVAKEPLTEIQSIFGGTIRHTDKVSGNRKPRHTWTLSTLQAKDFLEQIKPYSKNKGEVIDLGIEFQGLMGTGKVSDEMYNLRQDYKEKITHINSLD